MSKITFEKNYTRDTALFLQDIFARNQSIELPELLEKENPNLPGVIHYVNKGLVEIWENTTATQYLMDILLDKNIQDPLFFEEQVELYLKYLEEIKKYWSKGVLTSKEDLESLGKLITQAMTGFNIFYRTAFDDRTPKELREMALEIREADVFFSQNDHLISKSLSIIFPETKGYENYIFATELNNLPDLETLKRRKEAFLVIDGTDTFLGTIKEFSSLHPEYEFEFDEIKEDIKEIKGQIAFKGKVLGKVKLVLFREEVNKVEKGDILVSPMTTPDLLPAMEKAGAFVTDEGGITCHAAIVAREMKKPCIIGTKIATKVFKDGDMVEVDAERGIVKKIN